MSTQNAPAAPRMGRPLKSEEGPKSAALRFRVREDLRHQVEIAAAGSGRTISEEAEKRLENSFKHENLLRLIFNAGPASVFLQKLAGGLMAIHEYEIAPGQRIGTSNWQSSDATRAAVRAMLRVLIDEYIPPPRSPSAMSAAMGGDPDPNREKFYIQTVEYMQAMAHEMALRSVGKSSDEYKVSDPADVSSH